MGTAILGGVKVTPELDFILKNYVTLNQVSPIPLDIDRGGLCKIFRRLNYRVGAEIGVSKGRFSRLICQYNRRAKLYCVDPWNAYIGYVERKGIRGQVALDKHYEECKSRLAPYNCELIKAFSMDAVKNFKDDSLDFVFIDGNHSFEYVVNDIAEWSKKVRVGGIVSGHDFWTSAEGFGYKRLDLDLFIKNLTPREKIQLCQVKDAVLAWTHTNKITPWFLTAADDLSSWFWVKE